jgi:bisphosphoglycerate-dependent phosphoglycerate mutase
MDRLLVLVRHGQSEWNLKNLFTGWRDVDLTEQGIAEARAAGKKLKAQGLQFDIAFTSVLQRAQRTLDLILEEIPQAGAPFPLNIFADALLLKWQNEKRKVLRVILGAFETEHNKFFQIERQLSSYCSHFHIFQRPHESAQLQFVVAKLLLQVFEKHEMLQIVSKQPDFLEPLISSFAEFDQRYARFIEPIRDDIPYRLDIEQELDGIPILRHQALNERNYGDLSGLNKDEARKRWGEEQVHLWRRSYDTAPPGGESLKDTAERVLPYYRSQILPRVLRNERVLVAAHGNSLRALVMELEHLSPSEIVKREIGTGIPLVYQLKEDGRVAEKMELSNS